MHSVRASSGNFFLSLTAPKTSIAFLCLLLIITSKLANRRTLVQWLPDAPLGVLQAHRHPQRPTAAAPPARGQPPPPRTGSCSDRWRPSRVLSRPRPRARRRSDRRHSRPSRRRPRRPSRVPPLPPRRAHGGQGGGVRPRRVPRGPRRRAPAAARGHPLGAGGGGCEAGWPARGRWCE